MTNPPEYRLLVVAIGEYDHLEPLPLAEPTKSVQSSFSQLGIDSVEHAHTAGADLTVTNTDAQDVLRRWFYPPPGDSSPKDDSRPTNSILYWSGHGEENSARLWLMTSDSPAQNYDSGNAIKIDNIGDALQAQDKNWDSEEPGWTLVILDCCQGGTGVRNLVHEFTRDGVDEPRNVGFLAGTKHGAESTGELSRTIAEITASYTGNDKVIQLREFVTRIVDELGEHGCRHDVSRISSGATLPTTQTVPGTLTTTVESLDPLTEVLSKAPQETVGHFLEKAKGTELDERAWYFEGRDSETRQLVHWLRTAASGMYVVTGDPGAGKSAFLGRLVIFAEPRILQSLLESGLLNKPPETDLVPPNDFDAVIHLTAKSYRDALERVVEVVAPITDSQLGVDIEEVVKALQSYNRPLTFLVDALDEALDPFIIATSLLRRLAGVDGVKVVVGTRRSLNEGPDQTLNRRDIGLINALGFLYDADTDSYRGMKGVVHPLTADPEAVERYVIRRLTVAEGSPYDVERSNEIARRIRSAGQPFLFARLATTELLARPELDDSEIDELLAEGHRGIFAAALDRFDQEDTHVVPLLRSLAYSLGRGFPQQGGIWKKATEAIHPGLEIHEADIRHALDVAAAYIVYDGEFNAATYRLAHRTFAEHFLDES